MSEKINKWLSGDSNMELILSNLETLPELPITVKKLFLFNCRFTLLDLSNMINLEVLKLSHNEYLETIIFPPHLKQLQIIGDKSLKYPLIIPNSVIATNLKDSTFITKSNDELFNKIDSKHFNYEERKKMNILKVVLLSLQRLYYKYSRTDDILLNKTIKYINDVLNDSETVENIPHHVAPPEFYEIYNELNEFVDICSKYDVKIQNILQGSNTELIIVINKIKNDTETPIKIKLKYLNKLETLFINNKFNQLEEYYNLKNELQYNYVKELETKLQNLISKSYDIPDIQIQELNLIELSSLIVNMYQKIEMGFDILDLIKNITHQYKKYQTYTSEKKNYLDILNTKFTQTISNLQLYVLKLREQELKLLIEDKRSYKYNEEDDIDLLFEKAQICGRILKIIKNFKDKFTPEIQNYLIEQEVLINENLEKISNKIDEINLFNEIRSIEQNIYELNELISRATDPSLITNYQNSLEELRIELSRLRSFIPQQLEGKDLEKQQTKAQTILEENQRKLKRRLEENEFESQIQEHKQKEIKESEESIKIKEQCSNKETILGDPLDTNIGITAIILLTSSDKYIVYCYQYDEILDIFENQEKLYEWDNGPTTKRVYKEPYMGVWIDENSYKLLNIFNTFVLEFIDVKKIGSGFGASRLHGVEERIYKLKPISFTKFHNKEKISEEDIINFKPTIQDINTVLFRNVEKINTEDGYILKSDTNEIKVNEDGYKIDI